MSNWSIFGSFVLHISLVLLIIMLGVETNKNFYKSNPVLVEIVSDSQNNTNFTFVQKNIQKQVKQKQQQRLKQQKIEQQKKKLQKKRQQKLSEKIQKNKNNNKNLKKIKGKQNLSKIKNQNLEQDLDQEDWQNTRYIDDLNDLNDDTGDEAQKVQFNSNNNATNQLMQLSDENKQYINSKIVNCWQNVFSIPAYRKSNYTVTVKVELAIDGSVKNVIVQDYSTNLTPESKNFKILMNTILQAFAHPTCTKFDLPAENYKSWKQLLFVFDTNVL